MTHGDEWEKGTPWQTPKSLRWFGMLALWLYAAFGILLPEVGSPAETLAALSGLLAVLVYGKGIRGSAPLWLLVAALGVQTLSWALGYWNHPEWVGDNPRLDRLAKLFIFIAVAWWLGGSTRNTLRVWSLALAGYLVASFTHGNGIHEWLTGLQGSRVGFGIRNMQHGSMLFGVALLGLIIFMPRAVLPAGRRVVWRLGVWLTVTLVCLTGVAIGQTRAVWLSLLLALPVAGVIWLLWSLTRANARRLVRPVLLGAVGVIVLVSALAVTFQETLVKRLTMESSVIAELVQGDFEAVPYTSIGIRIHSWRAALDWISERPLVGWGSEGRNLVIEHTPWLPTFVKEQFGHLHNFLLEVWVAYGLLGVMVIAVLSLWIGRGTWLSWRGGVMPNDIALFGAAFFVYWVVINQFESYNSFSTGVYVHNLLVGGLVTHIWRWQRESGRHVFPSLGQKAR